MSIVKRILFIFLAVFIILQFFRGTPPEFRDENPSDLINNEVIASEVSTMLRSACYDCHSMESVYPWYSYVTPVSWFLFDHVADGRDELNFSEWSEMSKKKQLHKLEEVSEMVLEEEMPLSSYLPLHPEAKLSAEQRKQISDWAMGLASEIQQR